MKWLASGRTKNNCAASLNSVVKRDIHSLFQSPVCCSLLLSNEDCDTGLNSKRIRSIAWSCTAPVMAINIPYAYAHAHTLCDVILETTSALLETYRFLIKAIAARQQDQVANDDDLISSHVAKWLDMKQLTDGPTAVNAVIIQMVDNRALFMWYCSLPTSA